MPQKMMSGTREQEVAVTDVAEVDAGMPGPL